MDDKLFNSLGFMAWYKDDLDEILNLISVGNEYIEDCKNDIRTINYGEKFTHKDFIKMGREQCSWNIFTWNYIKNMSDDEYEEIYDHRIK